MAEIKQFIPTGAVIGRFKALKTFNDPDFGTYCEGELYTRRKSSPKLEEKIPGWIAEGKIICL